MTEISREVESTAVADIVLLLCEDAKRLEAVKPAFSSPQYEVEQASDLKAASALGKKKIIDLVVCIAPFDGHDLAERTAAIARDPNLGRASAVHILAVGEKPEQAAVPRSRRDSLAFLPPDSGNAELLVKVSTLLRMRKLQADQRRADADLNSSNLRLRDLTSRFQRELAEAKEIQKAILPRTLPKSPACVFAAAYIPVDTVGGDLYDVWQISESKFGMLIADVTGHGLPAAFIGAMTKMALSYAKPESPAKMLEDINEGLSKIIPDGRFVTAAAATFNTADGKFHAACAGHPPPILLHANAEIELPELRGLPLGVSTGVKYDSYSTTLDPGAAALLVTDGVTECQNLSGEMFGLEGVAAAFKSSKQLKLAERLKDVYSAQKAFTSGRRVKDDITLLALSVNRESA